MTCLIEFFTQEHYRQSIAPDARLSPLYKDVLFFHWKDASRHAILGELEWVREDARLSAAERDGAVNDLIELLHGVDALLLFQGPADVDYFVEICNRTFTTWEMSRLHAAVLSAYRWQYIASGMQQPHFAQVLGKLVNANQAFRIHAELAPILREFADRPERVASDHPLTPGVLAPTKQIDHSIATASQ